MPASPHSTVLCRYRYDPLDRRVACTLHQQTDLQHFYCKSRLASEIQGARHRSIFQHDDQLLAQQSSQNAKVDTTLLATDQQRSVLNTQSATQSQAFAYTPYGERSPKNGLPSLLGFKGERLDPLTENYDLGKGYRRYNTRLMRFDSPDSLSPFGEGGLNAYGFVAGDPVNLSDPTGHSPVPLVLFGAATLVGVSSAIGAVYTEGELQAGLAVVAAVAGVVAIGSFNSHYNRGRQLNRTLSVTVQPSPPSAARRNRAPLVNTSQSDAPPAYDTIVSGSHYEGRGYPPPYSLEDPNRILGSLNNQSARPTQSPGSSRSGPNVPSSSSTNATVSAIRNGSR